MKNRGLKAVIILTLLINMSIFGTSYAAQWDVGVGQTYNTIQSAINNPNTADNDIIVVHKGTYSENVEVNKKLTIIGKPGDSVNIMARNSGFTVVKNALGDGSGTVIKGFKIINSNQATGINIYANNCKIEKNWIYGGKNGIITIGNNSKIQFNTISNVFNNSIQVGNSSIINSSGKPVLVANAPNNCKIEYNKMSGGMNGIGVLGNHTLIFHNIISGPSDIGIALFGTYPKISENKIINMVGEGSKTAITLATIGFGTSTGVIVNKNIVSNLKSLNNETKVIDVFGMSMNDNLDDIEVSRNIVSNIYGHTKSTIISLVGLALGGAVSNIKVTNNKISKVNTKSTNSSITGIAVVVIGLDDSKNKTTSSKNTLITNNQVSNLRSQGTNSSNLGISFVNLSKGKILLKENYLSNFSADLKSIGLKSVGVDFSSNESTVKFEKNMISDLYSNKITSGIESITLGNAEFMHNSIWGLQSSQSKAIAALTINKAILIGNNLQGKGFGEGIALKGPDATVSFNRIVNFQHYIQNISLLEFAEFSEGMTIDDATLRAYLISQKVPADKIDKIIAGFNQLVKKVDQMIGSKTNAPYNWYGTNKPSSNQFIKGNGTLIYYPWLVLNINAYPSIISLGSRSRIVADVYKDISGGNHNNQANLYFSGPQVAFTTNLGNVGSKYIKQPWTKGMSSTILKADEGPGVAKVTASDFQTVKTLVKIVGGPIIPIDTTAKQIKIEKYKTGAPLNYLLLALLMILGVIVVRKK